MVWLDCGLNFMACAEVQVRYYDSQDSLGAELIMCSYE